SHHPSCFLIYSLNDLSFVSNGSYHSYLYSFPTRRSSDLFWILPVAVCGISSTKATSSGIHHLAILPSMKASSSSFEGSLPGLRTDRKSTRLNSSHVKISYAVFCLKKKRINILFIVVVSYL